jgi:hypothetical protein
MRGVISPLPNTPSLRGAQLKNKGTTLTLALPLAQQHRLDEQRKELY